MTNVRQNILSGLEEDIVSGSLKEAQNHVWNLPLIRGLDDLQGLTKWAKQKKDGNVRLEKECICEIK